MALWSDWIETRLRVSGKKPSFPQVVSGNPEVVAVKKPLDSPIKSGNDKLILFETLKILCLLLVALISLSPAFAAGADTKPPLKFGKNPEVQQVRPKKPVRIKLHRNAKGEYQWDITGDNADEVVRADKRLRSLLLNEK